MRQKYFDSTEYNYQYYYKIDRDPNDNNKIIKEGKEIGGEECCHSVFSNVQYDLWLISYEECPPLDCNELNDNKNRKIMVKSFWKMEMVVIVQMKLQSRLGYLIMKNWWWTKTQLPKKPFIRSVLELSYLFDWFNPYELIVEAQNINLRAITAFGSTSRRLQVSLSIRHLHRNLLLNVIIHLTFLVIGEFYDRVKRSSTKNQLDRSIMLWSDVHSREKS